MIRYLGHLLLDRLLPPAGDVTLTHTQHAKLLAAAERSMAMIVEAEAHGVARGRREEREAVRGYLDALARSEQARDWSPMDALLVAAKDVEHGWHVQEVSDGE